jgi:hypothetical protein
MALAHCPVHFDSYQPGCTTCETARAVNTNYGDTRWQLPMPTRSEQDPSNYGGIRELEQALSTIHAQHLIVVGTCSDLLASFPPSITTEITAEYQQVFASFANLVSAMQDLHSHVSNARRDLNKL